MNKLILFLLVFSVPALTNAMNDEEITSDNHKRLKRIREIYPRIESTEIISNDELWKMYNRTSNKQIFEGQLLIYLNDYSLYRELGKKIDEIIIKKKKELENNV